GRGVVGGGGRAVEPRRGGRLAGDARAGPRQKAGLADPRLARDQPDLPFALPGQPLAPQQKIELVLAADEIGQTRRADRLEAALGIGYALDRPPRDRLGNPAGRGRPDETERPAAAAWRRRRRPSRARPMPEGGPRGSASPRPRRAPATRPRG